MKKEGIQTRNRKLSSKSKKKKGSISSSASASAGCHLGSFLDVMSMGAGSALDKAAAAAAAAAAAGFPSFAAAAAVASAAGASSAMSHYAVYAGNGQMHHPAHHHPHMNHSAAQMGGFHHHGSPSGPPPGSMAIHHSMGGISSSALGLGSTFNSMVRYHLSIIYRRAVTLFPVIFPLTFYGSIQTQLNKMIVGHLIFSFTAASDRDKAISSIGLNTVTVPNRTEINRFSFIFILGFLADRFQHLNAAEDVKKE